MIGLLIITHGKIGQELLAAASVTFEKLPLCVKTLEVESNHEPNYLLPKAKRLIKDLEQGHGVLILTDIYGSTPSNIAHALLTTENTSLQVVTGLNLPMLFRILNYSKLNLEQLALKALSGGKEGIRTDELTYGYSL